jgi:uracil-DNA glycosylase
MAHPDYDPGPPAAIAAQFAALPDYGEFKKFFWYDFGPIFYRGRLDGTAKVLCIASDPGPTERIACRTLVGDAGQRVQGFLAKLGLNRSYICVNAFAHAVFPSKANKAQPMLASDAHKNWRNGLFDLLKTNSLQAVIAFGAQAQFAVDLWPGKAGLALFELPHPSSHNATVLANRWRAAVTTLRGIVPPDPGAPANLPNYGATLAEADYAPIPLVDLPYGVAPSMGDDSWLRKSNKGFSSVKRPSPDDRHTLIWKVPKGK